MNTTKPEVIVAKIPSLESHGTQSPLDSTTVKPANLVKHTKRIVHNKQDLLDSINHIPEPIDEPLVKLMTSEVANSVPAEYDGSLLKLDTGDLETYK